MYTEAMERHQWQSGGTNDPILTVTVDATYAKVLAKIGWRCIER
jgi:hypothetical protein